MSVEKWWNEICGRGKWEKPREKPTQTHFVHHETHMEGPRRELGTPVVGGECLTACAMRPPCLQLSSTLRYEVELYIDITTQQKE